MSLLTEPSGANWCACRSSGNLEMANELFNGDGHLQEPGGRFTYNSSGGTVERIVSWFNDRFPAIFTSLKD